MNQSADQLKGKKLLLAAIVMAILGVLWAFYPGDILADHIQSEWERWFGLPWHEAAWHSILASLGVKFGPLFLLLGASYWLTEKVSKLNFSVQHRANIKQLGEARTALKQGISSLEEIEREYRGKLSSFEKIQKEIDELKSVKDIDTEDLQRKLNAISRAGRANRNFERFVGFAIGIISSLVATYIWVKL